MFINRAVNSSALFSGSPRTVTSCPTVRLFSVTPGKPRMTVLEPTVTVSDSPSRVATVKVGSETAVTVPTTPWPRGMKL